MKRVLIFELDNPNVKTLLDQPMKWIMILLALLFGSA